MREKIKIDFLCRHCLHSDHSNATFVFLPTKNDEGDPFDEILLIHILSRVCAGIQGNSSASFHNFQTIISRDFHFFRGDGIRAIERIVSGMVK